LTKQHTQLTMALSIHNKTVRSPQFEMPFSMSVWNSCSIPSWYCLQELLLWEF